MHLALAFVAGIGCSIVLVLVALQLSPVPGNVQAHLTAQESEASYTLGAAHLMTAMSGGRCSSASPVGGTALEEKSQLLARGAEEMS